MAAPTPTTRIACTLSSHDLATQRERWHEVAANALVDRVETDGGLRLAFRAGAGVAEKLGRLLEFERECCAWADWELNHMGDVLLVDVRSSGDGVTALHAMFTSLGTTGLE
jgi:hypothetical protein